ncbi:MAG TPA: hypothetical protein DCW90_03325 [Lachnospiraceae bacterium]|nr:hypothetical protein [Lachnospiraceae bacterium]
MRYFIATFQTENYEYQFRGINKHVKFTATPGKDGILYTATGEQQFVIFPYFSIAVLDVFETWLSECGTFMYEVIPTDDEYYDEKFFKLNSVRKGCDGINFRIMQNAEPYAIECNQFILKPVAYKFEHGIADIANKAVDRYGYIYEINSLNHFLRTVLLCIILMVGIYEGAFLDVRTIREMQQPMCERAYHLYIQGHRDQIFDFEQYKSLLK